MTANTIEGQVQDPASYFHSIERTCGQPIAHAQDLIRAKLPATHEELAAMLKDEHDEHGTEHGHANALVAATLN